MGDEADLTNRHLLREYHLRDKVEIFAADCERSPRFHGHGAHGFYRDRFGEGELCEAFDVAAGIMESHFTGFGILRYDYPYLLIGNHCDIFHVAGTGNCDRSDLIHTRSEETELTATGHRARTPDVKIHSSAILLGVVIIFRAGCGDGRNHGKTHHCKKGVFYYIFHCSIVWLSFTVNVSESLSF